MLNRRTSTPKWRRPKQRTIQYVDWLNPTELDANVKFHAAEALRGGGGIVCDAHDIGFPTSWEGEAT